MNATAPTAPSPPAAPLRLYLQPDGSIGAAPPATEGTTTLATPVNGPLLGTPSWKGTLAAPARVEKEIAVVLYAETNSVSVSGGQIPASGFHQVDVYLTLGSLKLYGQLAGPDVIQAGEVAKFSGKIPVANATDLPAGTPVALDDDVFYSHVMGAAEFRFVMGPDHPSGFGAGSFPDGH
jgi:hypothetical protein